MNIKAWTLEFFCDHNIVLEIFHKFHVPDTRINIVTISIIKEKKVWQFPWRIETIVPTNG
jgi:hypothetical protein